MASNSLADGKVTPIHSVVNSTETPIGLDQPNIPDFTTKKMPRRRDERFVRKVTFWRQCRALFLKDITLQYRAWATSLCQIIAPAVILAVAGLMQVITNAILVANDVKIPGSGSLPFPQALTLNVPCTIDSSKHPVECVDPTVNLIPYAGFTVEEIEQLIKTFNISFSKKYQKELEMFLEDSRSCHQMTLYSLPFYYLVNEAGTDLGELTYNGTSRGFLELAVNNNKGGQFEFPTSFVINDKYRDINRCRMLERNESYNTSLYAPFFTQLNSSADIDNRLVDIIREYDNVAATSSRSISQQYKSLYYLNPTNQDLYDYVLKQIQDGPKHYTTNVRPTGGFIFHKYNVSQRHLHYTVVTPLLSLFNTTEVNSNSHLISMINNAWFKVLVGDNTTEPLIQTFISPLPSESLLVKIDVTAILGGILFPFAASLLLPIYVSALVKDKQEKYLIMMEQSGLSRLTYWVIKYMFDYIMYICVFIILTAAAFAFQLRLFTQTHPVLIILTFLLWGNGQIATAFLFSNFFGKSRTAVIVTIIIVLLQVNILELLEFINVLPIDQDPIFLVMLYPPVAFYRLLGYMDNACLQMSCYGIDKLGSLNLVTKGLLYLFGSSIFFFLLGAYLSFVLPSAYGVRRSIFFPIIAIVKLVVRGFQRCGFIKTKTCGNSTPLPNVILGLEDEEDPIDEDVLAEEERLSKGFPEDVPIIMYKLRKEYAGSRGKPPHIAVHSMSLAIERNECFGLLGPNGAGKTTLISVLSGLYEPTEGVAKIAGYDLQTEIRSVYSHLGVCPQFDIQWTELTAREHLLFYARLKGVKVSYEKAVVLEALNQVNLFDAQKRKSKALSGGMKRRLSVAMAIIGNPDILILDEPTTGLDPESRRQVWEVIETVKQNRSVILTTHAMEEADHLCTDIGIMNYGKLRCLGSQNRLKTKFGTGYQLQFNSSPGQIRAVESFVKAILPKAVHVETYADKCTYQIAKKDLVISELFDKVHSSQGNVPIVDWGVKRTTLEDVFLAIVNRGVDRRTPPSRGLLEWLPCQQCCNRRRHNQLTLSLSA